MSAQPSLFDAVRPLSLEERFEHFRRSNVRLVAAIERDVLQRVDGGARYLSMRRIFEDFRGYGTPEPGTRWRLNNDLTAPMARWLIARHPHLAPIIRLRKSKVDA
jgi:hypothetical protein